MKIENIVCSGSFNQELDLNKLSSTCPYVEYKKNNYPAAYLKFNGHSITIYHTGKYIMPGMRTFNDVQESFDTMKCYLSSYVDTSIISCPEIRNIVCSSNIKCVINLNTIYVELTSRDLDVVYDPEAFPGLILRAERCTYNIFSSGKFLILGCISKQQAIEAEQYLLKTIDEL